MGQTLLMKQTLVRRIGIVWLGVLCALTTLSPAQADPMIDFTQMVEGGDLSYDGDGGALIGTAIPFDRLRGFDTPRMSGVTLDCVDCRLHFATGANLTEGAVYTWASGGFYTLTGTLMANTTAVMSGTVLTGAWSAPVFGATPGGGLLIISGVGGDVLHADLANFYGINTLEFVFATSAIATSTVVQANGGFRGTVSGAGLMTTPTPEPGTLLLLSTGLIGILGYGWKRWTATTL